MADTHFNQANSSKKMSKGKVEFCTFVNPETFATVAVSVYALIGAGFDILWVQRQKAYLA